MIFSALLGPTPLIFVNSAMGVSANCSIVSMPLSVSFCKMAAVSPGSSESDVRADNWAICSSISARFSSSLLMSIFQPVSLAASLTFCPFLPIARDN
jgi:hypothetical protein